MRRMETPATPESKGSPWLTIGVALALVVGVVFLLRRGADTSPAPQPSAPVTSGAAPAGPSGASVVDLPTARKQLALFLTEAGLAHEEPLVEAGTRLDKALAKDDCLAARQPYDVIKETKVDLTTHTALVLNQIRMLTSVGAYCNAWSDLSGSRW
jgi:hypothetical protein